MDDIPAFPIGGHGPGDPLFSLRQGGLQGISDASELITDVFFLGQDIREPRAFGIYQDADGLFVVYKNKANGERAVRYRGRDEAYAVNELR